MKKTYTILLSCLLLLGLFLGMILIKIPTPQVKIDEKFELNIK